LAAQHNTKPFAGERKAVVADRVLKPAETFRRRPHSGL